MSWNLQDGLTPIGARVLVKLLPKYEFYDATKLIKIPDQHQKQQEAARVIAVGTRATGWKVGVRLLTGKWNGTPCPAPEDDPDLDGEPRYYFLRVPLWTDKGAKMPVAIYGRTHLPVADEIYAVIDDDSLSDAEVVEMTARDLSRKRFAK